MDNKDGLMYRKEAETTWSPTEVVEQPEEAKEVRESTYKDYALTLNPFAMTYYNPELAFDSATDRGDGVDMSDDEFRNVYSSLDVETKREVLKASSNSHAYKIIERTNIIKDSQEATAQDGILTQIGMGLAPALLSPTTLLPAGMAFKTLQIGSKAARITKTSLVGGVSGATAAGIDESLFDVQGMPTDYTSVMTMGFVLGGGAGMLAGALTGSTAKDTARLLHPDTSEIGKRVDIDPSVKTEVLEDGSTVYSIESQKIGSIVPEWFSKFADSSVTRMYKSDSTILRQEAMRIANPTIALKDADGNYIALGRTALDIKQELNGNRMKALYDLDESYTTWSTTNKGTRDDFEHLVHKEYTRISNNLNSESIVYADKKLSTQLEDIKKQRRLDLKKAGEVKDVSKKDIKKAKEQIKEEYTTKIKELRRSYIKEYYDTNKPDLTNTDPSIVSAMNRYQQYYDEMLENGQKVGLEELGGLNTGRWYNPRAWNFERLDTIDKNEALHRISQALDNNVRNGNLDATELIEKAEEVYTMLKDKNYEANSVPSSGYYHKDLPAEVRLKARGLHLDDSYLGDLVNNNMLDSLENYHYFMSGRQAVSEVLGKDAKVALPEITSKLRKEGLSENEIKAYQETVDDILGTLRLDQYSGDFMWKLQRNVATFNSLRLMGGAGGNQLIELATITGMNAIRGVFTSRFGASIKSSVGILRGNNPNKDSYSKMLLDSGYLEAGLSNHRANKFSEGDAGMNMGTLEKWLRKTNDKFMVLNGMRPALLATEDQVGSIVLNNLKQGLSGKDSKETLARFARWGIPEKEVNELAEAVKKVSSKKELRLEELSEKHQGMLQLAITRGVQEFVIQGDSIHLPTWFKKQSPLGKMITQFLRFPFIANEVYLRKGYTQEQASMMAGITSAVMITMSMSYMREQAAIELDLKDKHDAQYDYFGDDSNDALKRGAYRGFSYIANLGMLPSAIDAMRVPLGIEAPGKDWKPSTNIGQYLGATAGLAEDVIKASANVATGKNSIVEGGVQLTDALLIGKTLPILSESWNALKDEYGE